MKMVDDDMRIAGLSVSFTLIFDKPTDPFMRSVVKAAEAAIHAYASKDAQVDIKTRALQAPRPDLPDLLPGVRNIIAVSSGKGGVGKSTVAVNLAVALARMGLRVGLLDCDIFGPSAPKMFQMEEARPYSENVDGRDLIMPVEKYGVKVLSIGFFVSPDQGIMWRGGMASNALKQLIGDANWGNLDYFILDTPPGTSDIHLTLVQTIPITGAVIVSTPQQVALADARKGIDMYRNEKIDVPILGLVENMAWFSPAQHPDERYYLFGREGVKQLAEEMHVPLLAQIPIVQDICQSSDDGIPAATDPASITGQAFMQLAARVVTETDKRQALLPPTEIVKLKS
jgi:ATP-binding protein involved in chromosome partitioning